MNTIKTIWNKWEGIISFILSPVFKIKLPSVILERPKGAIGSYRRADVESNSADALLQNDKNIHSSCHPELDSGSILIGGVRSALLNSFKKRKILVVTSLFILFTLPVVILGLKYLPKAEASWYDDNFAYRQTVAITNAGTVQTDYQIAITLNTSALVTAGKMQSDCDDIRITDVNGKVLPHWIEENNPGCNQTTTKIWTKVPSISTTGITLYIYYGNPAAISVQNGNTVFEFFDDFNAANLDSSKWSSSGPVTLNSGIVTLNRATADPILWNLNAFPVSVPFITEAKYQHPVRYRNRMYLATTVGGGSPTGYDYGIFSPSIYWNGFTGVNLTIDTWYIVKWENLTNNYIWRILNLDYTEVINRSYGSAISNAKYLMFEGTESDSSDFKLDWVRVRKYAATEPSVASPTNEEQAPGPVAYWKFDEGYGGTAQDSTSNNNDGSLGTGSSAPTWATEDMCVSGKCLKFDGNNDYINAGSGTSLNLNNNFTISTWIKVPSNATVNGMGIVAWGEDTAGKRRSLLLWNGGSGRNKVYFSGYGASANLSGTSTIDDNKWHYVAVTLSSGNVATVYVDGIQENSGSVTLSSYTYGNVYMGATLLSGDATGEFYNGFIDEPKIYPYARSAAQIKADFASRGSAKGISAQMGGQENKNLSNGLVGYWKMDEGSWNGTSNEVIDSSSNANHGTRVGDATTASGKYGNGGTFDGTGDYVQLTSDSSNLKPTNTLTVSAWVKPTDVSTWHQIVTKRYSESSDPYNSYILTTTGAGASNKWYFCVSNGTSSSQTCIADTDVLVAGSWSNITGIYDGSKLIIYVNGVPKNSTSKTGTIGYSTIPLRIGAATSSQVFKGSIDEARVYNRALSPREVSQLYNFAPGPVGYWNMDEKTGGYAYDISGNSNTGTLGAGSSAPTWNSGKYGGALSFDGSNDYIAVNSQTLLTSDQVTVTAWIKHGGKSSASQDIIAKRTSLNNDQFEFMLSSTYNLVFDRYLPSGGSVTSNSTIPINQWTHVAMTLNDSENTVSFYINGILDSTRSYTETYSGDSSSTITIGRSGVDSNDGTSDPWRNLNGKIDDVKVYNYARTQKQIVQDMNGGHPSVGSPVGSAVAYYKFDEGRDNACSAGVNDACNSGSGGSALDGAQTGMEVPATSTSGWTNNGKFNKALLFDGSNDQITHTTLLDAMPSQLTLSGWFKPDASKSANMAGMGKVNIEFQDRMYIYFLMSGSTPTTIAFDYEAVNGGYTRVDTGITWTDDTWYHVAATWDTTNGIKVYVNGNLKATSSSATTLPLGGTNDDFVIGNNEPSATGGVSAFKGTIDEVKIYNFALTADEVKLDYNRGSSIVLGSLSDNSSYQKDAANQEYCVPGDTTSCASPVAEWKMDERTGGYAYDTSGNNNTGTLGVGSSAPTWTSGKVGQALSFDGNDYVGSGHILDTTFAGADKKFSIQTWIKPATAMTNNLFIAKVGDSNCSENQRQFGLRLLTSSKPEFYWYNALDGTSYRGVLGSTSVTDTSRWYNIALTYDGSIDTNDGLDRVKFYVDGKTESTTLDLTSGTLGDIPDGTAHLGIGKSLNSSGAVCGSSGFFNGKMDQMRIYNYIRTPAQVAWDYNHGGPVAHYKMDECNGATLNDASGNGNTGTIYPVTLGNTAVGTCSSGTATEMWNDGTNGKFNASLGFDGSDDYVSVTDTSVLEPTQTTMSIWIKPTSWSTDTHPVLINKRSVTTDGYMIFKYDVTNTINIDFGGSSQRWDTGILPSTGTWTHLVYTYDGTNGKIYINGSLRNTTGLGSGAGVPSAGNFYIGADSLDNDNSFDGLIDDVRIYNYALTSVQIKNLFNGGSAVRFGPSTGTP